MDRSIRLIIVDDNPHALRGLCAMLATQPRIDIVGEASQGLEAIALVESKQPHVALMDLRMPVMDGIQATRAIKEHWPEVRVILISIYADYQGEALESGADAFLVKGCPAEELVSAIVGAQPNQTHDCGQKLPARIAPGSDSGQTKGDHYV